MAEPTHPPENELNEKIAEAQKEIAAKNNTHPEAHGEHREEKKPISTLESVVNESSHLIGSGLKLALAGTIPFAQATMFPQLARDTAILSGAQIASDYTTSLQRGKKYTAGSLLESAAIGTAITAPLEAMFGIVNKMPLNAPLDYVAKAGVWGGIVYPVFNGLYLPTAYLIRNRTFKGMGKYVRENYWPILKKSMKYILPFSLLNVFFAPAALQIPIAAALSFVYDRFTADKGEFPEDQKRDKTPYYVAAPRVIGKLGKSVFYGVPSAAYAIGNSLYNGLKKLYTGSAKSASPSPVPAGARP